MGLLTFKSKGLKWALTAAFNYIMRSYREDRAKLILEPHSNGMRGNRQKLQNGEFQLDYKESLSLWLRLNT